MAACSQGADESGGIPATLPVAEGGIGLSASAAVPLLAAKLVCRQGGVPVPVVVGTPVTIGRRPGCSIRVASAHASGVHCTVEAKEGHAGDPELFITDSSGNGTLVNDRRIAKGATIRLKDTNTISLVVRAAKSSKQLPCFDVQVTNHDAGAAGGSQEPPMFSQTTVPERLASKSKRYRNFYARFQKGALLGTGSYATVYAATKRSTGEAMAVKVVDKRRLNFPGNASVSDLVQEAHMLAGVRHPCFLRLQDVLESSDYLYLVTDLARGGELFERLFNLGAYPETRARRLAWRLAAAVSHMHGRGIVHRDLKPENVLILDEQDDTSVVIADFGVAKTVGAGGLNTYCGTPQYQAPEVMIAQRPGHSATYGRPADMWSLGVIMFVVLCGNPPFTPDMLQASGAAVQWAFAPPAKWDGVSAAAKDLITSLLHPDPAARCTVQGMLDHVWLAPERCVPEQAALLAEPTPAPTPAPSPQAGQAGPRPPPPMMRQSTGGTASQELPSQEAVPPPRVVLAPPPPPAAAAGAGGAAGTPPPPAGTRSSPRRRGRKREREGEGVSGEDPKKPRGGSQ